MSLPCRSDNVLASGNMNPPAGVQRALLLTTAGGNRRLFVTFFETRDESTAAEEHFESMGDEIPEHIRGCRTGVDTYEVLFEDEM